VIGKSFGKGGKIMRSSMWCVVTAGFLAVTLVGLSIVQAADQKQTTHQKQPVAQKQATDPKPTADPKPGDDRWRYTFHNDEWWYWLPAGRWVYWRNSQWNKYDPKNYVAPIATDLIAATPVGSIPGNRTTPDADTRPFYGRAVSDLDRRALAPNNEVGPFYGRTLPNEIIGGWGNRRSDRPFYGRAGSSGN
jgi:hypothetical protein